MHAPKMSGILRRLCWLLGWIDQLEKHREDLQLNIRKNASIPSLRELQDFDQAFDGSFSLVAFILNRHLIDHMLRTSRLLVDGDLESLILWGVLAHQNVAHLMPPGTIPTAILNDSGLLPDLDEHIHPLLLRDISAITGIPRETARRKLDALAEQGYVERKGRAWVVSTQRLDPDLREFTRDSIRRMLAAADELRAALAIADKAAAQRASDASAVKTSTGSC